VDLRLTKVDTYFAPAKKLDQGDIYLQTIKVLGERKLIKVLNLLPNIVAIINMERQILFANNSFIKAINMENFEDGLGMRPGDLFACVNSHDTEFGCGTGKDCKYCSLILTFLKSQETGVKQENVGTITVERDGKNVPLTFHVIASPLTIDNEIFYIIILTPKNK